MEHKFIEGNSLEEIIDDNSVEMFLLYPPFYEIDHMRYGNPDEQINNVKSYKKFLKNLVKIIKNAEKALKDHGNIVMALPISDPHFLPDIIDAVGKQTKLQLAPPMIWSYFNTEYTDQAHYPMMSFCNVVVLSKGLGAYDSEFRKNNHNPVVEFKFDESELMDYAMMGHVGDFMPIAAAEYFVQSFSKPGDTVVDLFGGTGTTSLAAENTGRNSIYVDCSKTQVAIAKKRLEDLIDQKKRQKK